MIQVRSSVPLAPLSTFKIGGRAEFFCAVHSDDELFRALQWARARKIPHHIIGEGSNIVFPDGLLRGLLIKIKGKRVEGREESRIVADAGVPLQKVVQKAIAVCLGGLETLSGIPGTLGGAIVGNAGAYGHSISEVVEKVEVCSPVRSHARAQARSEGPLGRAASNGMGWEKHWISKEDCRFGYRGSIFKQKPYIVLRAELRLHQDDPLRLRKISRDIIALRLKKYKPGLRCPGSFFKNVLVRDVSRRSLARIMKEKIIDGKIPTGYLLEQVGAKGIRVGGIEIANFHGNLFINRGGATARDVRLLARILKQKVKQKFGITLEEEIRYFR